MIGSFISVTSGIRKCLEWTLAFPLCEHSGGLHFFHVNVQSLVNKINSIRLWAELIEGDIFVLSETWLKPSIMNNMIHIDGY